MPNLIPAWLVTQFKFAQRQGWLPSFHTASARVTEYVFRTEDLLAIASRESNLKNIKGDFRDGKYNGFSLMQLDIGSHRAWIESGAWTDPHKAITKGAEALMEKRQLIIKASQQKSVLIKFRSGKTARFTPKPFTTEQLRRISIASYNCGMAAYYHFSIGNSIDAGTTGKNYSKDVLERSAHFKKLLRAEEPEVQAALPDAPVAESEVADASKLSVGVANATAALPNYDYDAMHAKVTQSADIVQSEGAKSTFLKLALRIGGGITAVWSTTAGKIALVLTAAVIVGSIGFTVYAYRVQIKHFITGLQAWAFKGVTKDGE